MKYLPLLLFTLCLACQQQSARRPTTPAADTVLESTMIKPLTDSIRQFPDQAGLYFRRALLLFNTDPALALHDFEKAANLQPTITDHWAGAGESALVTEQYDKAAQFFEKALHTAPANTYLQYRLAMSWIERKAYDRADSLATVMAQQPQGYAQAFYLKARIAEDHKDTLQAISHLKAAVDKAGPQSEYEAVMELADLLAARQDAAAARYYEMAYSQDPANAEPLYAMGQYFEAAGKPKEATVAYKRCIEADPGYADAYIALGKMSVNGKQWKAALGDFTLAAKARPTDATAYYYRGLCYEQLGNKDAAQSDYAKAVTFRKDYPEAKAALERITK
ncbi:tetratricopeptide repeat protein [Chitinophaga agrisoli]|nr:tetratricopeptide repeat protein [Chitinophaga agrisoli]